MSSPPADHEPASLEEERRKKKRVQFCQNCGQLGHASKACSQPVISCGVILFDRVPAAAAGADGAPESSLPSAAAGADGPDPINREYFRLGDSPPGVVPAPPGTLRYLLIRRKDSLNYTELLRGKYDMYDVKFLWQMVGQMTQSERARLATQPFMALWRQLWSSGTGASGYSGGISAEYSLAEAKFNTLRHGYRTPDGRHVCLATLLARTSSPYTVPEAGICKGKRSKREGDLACAQRECQEETGVRPGEYSILHQLGAVNEVYRGSNSVIYRHNYYVARYTAGREIVLNMDDPDQLAEVGAIGWYTLAEALRVFRPHEVEKKALLMRLDDVLSRWQFPEERVVEV